jgi:hypothetical protein
MKDNLVKFEQVEQEIFVVLFLLKNSPLYKDDE